jgi:hypothetical protein
LWRAGRGKKNRSSLDLTVTKVVLYSLDLVPSAKLYPRSALILLTALNLLNYVDRSVLFAVQPLVQSEFRLSNTQVGYLTSARLLSAERSSGAVSRYSPRSLTRIRNS